MLVWGVALVALAFLLLAIEVFVPSAGLLSIGAAVSAIVGIVLLWRVSPTWGLTGLAAVIVLGPAMFLFLLNTLPSTKAGRALIGAPSEEERAQKVLDERAARDARAALVGAEGTALTALRPVGVIEIDGSRYDALAEAGAIDAGARVRVTRATMAEIKVRAIS
jgi:membrane-bound serine protease (ClpP class)